MIIKFPDGNQKEYPEGISPLEIAKEISPNLAKKTVAAKVNDTITDTTTPITTDSELKLITSDTPEDEDLLYVIRHSTAHVMAEAICNLWPEAKLVYGPPVENGFYYDIDLETPISETDFSKIEKEMKQILKKNPKFCRYELTRAEALEKLGKEGNEYKIENTNRAEGDVISFYKTGATENTFEDLCMGPHVPSAKFLGSFKVMSVAGSYLHGDASKKALQRVYGTAWPTKEQLENYLFQIEEAKKRDHRTLGKQLDLFSVHQDIGPGLILWHPNGATVRHEVEQYWLKEHKKREYKIVYTPHIASERTYQTSGHLQNYGDMMYSPMDIDGENYYAKPMNCPAHIQIFKANKHSYRELPIKLCELGTVYRYEPSGTLHGMMRVRGFTQDDSHLFCTIEQLADEVAGILELVDVMMNKFGYTYKAFLATRPEKSLGTDDEWEWSTNALVEALNQRGLDYEVDEGGGVFYAPKIDIKLRDSLGREWQGPTIQVDLNLPKRFDVNYTGADNQEHNVVMVHRTVLGSMERFVGGLIEHYAGSFPTWLAPVQVKVLTISEKHIEYGKSVNSALIEAGVRSELDATDDKVGAKIRKTHGQHVPYMLIVGKEEAESNTVNIRKRGEEDQRQSSLEDLIAEIQSEL